jgi:hypothetical protein
VVQTRPSLLVWKVTFTDAPVHFMPTVLTVPTPPSWSLKSTV